MESSDRTGGAGKGAARQALSRLGPTATMRDIALAAGVSPSTVSRVLNDSPSAVPIADAIPAAAAHNSEVLERGTKA